MNAASAALQLRPYEIEGIFMHDPREFFGALMGQPGSNLLDRFSRAPVGSANVEPDEASAAKSVFEHQSLQYFLIHAGYDLVGYVAMGAILGFWHS